MTARQELIKNTAALMHENGIQVVMDEDLDGYIQDALFFAEDSESALEYYTNLTSIRAIVRLWNAIRREFDKNLPTENDDIKTWEYGRVW